MSACIVPFPSVMPVTSYSLAGRVVIGDSSYISEDIITW